MITFILHQRTNMTISRSFDIVPITHNITLKTLLPSNCELVFSRSDKRALSIALGDTIAINIDNKMAYHFIVDEITKKNNQIIIVANDILNNYNYLCFNVAKTDTFLNQMTKNFLSNYTNYVKFDNVSGDLNTTSITSDLCGSIYSQIKDIIYNGNYAHTYDYNFKKMNIYFKKLNTDNVIDINISTNSTYLSTVCARNGVQTQRLVYTNNTSGTNTNVYAAVSNGKDVSGIIASDAYTSLSADKTYTKDDIISELKDASQKKLRANSMSRIVSLNDASRYNLLKDLTFLKNYNIDSVFKFIDEQQNYKYYYIASMNFNNGIITDIDFNVLN